MYLSFEIGQVARVPFQRNALTPCVDFIDELLYRAPVKSGADLLHHIEYVVCTDLARLLFVEIVEDRLQHYEGKKSSLDHSLSLILTFIVNECPVLLTFRLRLGEIFNLNRRAK